MVRLLSAHTDRGQAYRVDLRASWPEGHRGPLAAIAGQHAWHTTTRWDAPGSGRRSSRSAAAAGDLRRWAGALPARRYRAFCLPQISQFRGDQRDQGPSKRRIEHKTHDAGDGERDVKTGRGGIRDIEFTIQFLQLLNGGDLPEVRQPQHTRGAWWRPWKRVGCLTHQEYRVLDDAYRFLRKTEHRLQLLFDLQTHRLPEGDEELRKLALRMGYGAMPKSKV